MGMDAKLSLTKKFTDIYSTKTIPSSTEQPFNTKFREFVKSEIWSKITAEFYNCLEFETAIRFRCYEISSKKHDFEENVKELFSILDLLVVLNEIDASYCDAVFPFLILEELMDIHSLTECRRLYEYFETRSVLLDGLVSNRGRGPVLLRISNELLRRLSRQIDPALCGRIHILLSKAFAPEERSGSNVRGDYNLENSVITTKVSSPNIPASDGNEASYSQKVQSLYQIFWELQDLLVQPPKIAQISDNLQKFLNSTNTILESFESIQKNTFFLDNPKPTINPTSNALLPEKYTVINDNLCPNYIRSPPLFDFQLIDESFRLQFLLQAVILCDFLLDFSKERLESRQNRPFTNKSVAPNTSLSDEDEKNVSNLLNRIFALLKELKNGAYFDTVTSVINVESNWKNWKGFGCLSFEKPLLDKSILDEAVAGLKKVAGTPPKIRYAMGNAALAKIWKNAGENSLEDLKKKERYQIPTPKSFLSGVRHDSAEIEESVKEDEREYHQQAKASKTWRAFRSAINSHLEAFEFTGLGDLELLSQAIEGHTTLEKPKTNMNPAFDINIVEKGDEKLHEKVIEEQKKQEIQDATPMDEDKEPESKGEQQIEPVTTKEDLKKSNDQKDLSTDLQKENGKDEAEYESKKEDGTDKQPKSVPKDQSDKVSNPSDENSTAAHEERTEEAENVKDSENKKRSREGDVNEETISLSPKRQKTEEKENTDS
ncbi:THO complex subunit [Schizosaccharomyces cryophilus OY26]|uniref:THO complex subunit n=1 Tax=Schizosaccharomyces cryophilus (strain OY26 / ATCC MYA-4695 / CBS 11777 / NBRC 106824 / NRRL Y48691) TaxID=653667 RepID=S9VX70_SCHCR|nr:THO complex subunit [Schizosaccharomyces cryophilus OY26]EPY50590.1 THO complex subunit [Schizosaccharomyces cryophilus OY26]